MAGLGPLSTVTSTGLGTLTGLFGNDDAEQAQLDAINAAKGDVNSGYSQAQGLEKPIYDQGIASLGSLTDKYNSGGFSNPTSTPYAAKAFDPSQIGSDPEYKALLKQGQDAITGSAEAQGGLFSGNTDRALETYGENTAAQQENTLEQENLQNNEFGEQNQQQAYANNAANNSTQFNEGAGLAENAQTGASSLGSLYTNQGSDLGNLELGKGDVRSNTIRGDTGLIQGGINSLGSIPGNTPNTNGTGLDAGGGDGLGSMFDQFGNLLPQFASLAATA